MAELYQILEITKALMIFIFVLEIYLIINNVPYVIFKLRYYLPPLLKYNRRAKRFRYLIEVSRAGYLFFLTGCTAIVVFKEKLFETTHISCQSLFHLSFVYNYLVLNCRVLFAFSKLMLFKLCVDKPFWNETIGFIVTGLFFSALFIYCWTLYRPKVAEDVCFSTSSIPGTMLIFSLLFAYEFISFILYYKPLKEADRISTEHLSTLPELLSCAEEQADGGNIENDFPTSKSFESQSVSSSSSTNKGKLTFEMSTSRIDLVIRFHRIVRRNYWAGITSVLASTSMYFVYVLFHCVGSDNYIIPLNERVWYFRSGAVTVIERTLGVIIYIAMMLTENNWRRAFLPFCFWQKEVWDV